MCLFIYMNVYMCLYMYMDMYIYLKYSSKIHEENAREIGC